MKTIYLNESQFYKIFGINEGIEYTRNDSLHNGFNFNINSKQDDRSNKEVDTRVFGNKQDILFGDKTKEKKVHSLAQSRDSKMLSQSLYQELIRWVENGRTDKLRMPSGANATKTTILKWVNEKGYDDNTLISKAKSNLEKKKFSNEVLYNRYDKATQSYEERQDRYLVFNVPGTNVKCISLFTMNDFNFSDAIKHGALRQNPGTDKMLNIKDTEREHEEDGVSLKKLPIQYDNGVNPDIESNFSLKNVRQGHYTSNYGYEGADIGHGQNTSVASFLNKSIQYAAYALDKEGFKPDFIINCPSSSRFNDLYCQRLARKLNVEYVKDFFKRDVVNVMVDGKDIDFLRQQGFPEKEILDFQTKVKAVALKEIGYIISKPIQDLIASTNIQVPKYAQVGNPGKKVEKLSNRVIAFEMYKYIFDFIKESFKTDELDNRVIRAFLNSEQKKSSYRDKKDGTDTQYMFKYIVKHIGKETLMSVIYQVYELMMQYKERIIQGYKPTLITDRPKMVEFDQRFRPYVKNAYIIADKNFTTNKGHEGELFSRYKNAKFLIFDEDLNSGATLKMVIDALNDKIDNNSNNIIALVNAYSSESK